jgi:hypothetical protein
MLSLFWAQLQTIVWNMSHPTSSLFRPPNEWCAQLFALEQFSRWVGSASGALPAATPHAAHVVLVKKGELNTRKAWQAGAGIAMASAPGVFKPTHA